MTTFDIYAEVGSKYLKFDSLLSSLVWNVFDRSPVSSD